MPGPVPVLVEAYSAEGDRFPLGQHAVVPTQHLRLEMADLLAPLGEGAPRSGSLRISFIGDDRTLSGWLVQRRGRHVLEVALQSSEAATTNWQGYLDLRRLPRGKAAPTYFVANHGTTPANYHLTLGHGERVIAEHSGTVAAGSQQALTYEQGALPRTWTAGWMKLSHDADPGVFLAEGRLRRPDFLASLPLIPDHQTADVSYRSIHLPFRGEFGVATQVVLYSPLDDSEVQVELVDGRSGMIGAQRTFRLRCGEVRTVRLGSLIDAHPDPGDPGVLIRSTAPIHVSGSSQRSASGGVESSGREVVDLAFFATSDGHATGTYPLPDFPAHDFTTTLVNLAAEETSIVGQIYWDGGTYAFGPLDLEAGRSVDISIRDLVAAQEPDLLGRKLPSGAIDNHGLLPWIRSLR